MLCLCSCGRRRCNPSGRDERPIWRRVVCGKSRVSWFGDFVWEVNPARAPRDFVIAISQSWPTMRRPSQTQPSLQNAPSTPLIYPSAVLVAPGRVLALKTLFAGPDVPLRTSEVLMSKCRQSLRRCRPLANPFRCILVKFGIRAVVTTHSHLVRAADQM